MKALEIGSFEAKNKLSSLLVMAEHGQKIFITRRGKRVAMLSAPDEPHSGADESSPEHVLTALRAIRSAAKSGGESLKDLIDEGRHR